MKGFAIVIMGVTGSGKSTIGILLAKALHCNFIDADDFHSIENKGHCFGSCFTYADLASHSQTWLHGLHFIEKMNNGFPLTDEDRVPWLEAVRDAMVDYIMKGKTVIVACSALQPKYREILRTADPEYGSGFYDGVSHQKTKPISFSSDEGSEHAQSLFSRRVVFVCLQASAELIASRLDTRSKEGVHFMSPTLLQSQVDLLQIDDAEGIFFLDATLSPEVITKNIQRKISDSQLLS